MGFNHSWQGLKGALPDVWCYGEVKTGRELVSRIAEDMKLTLGNDVWARSLLAYTQNVIIDDLRFLSEVEVIKQFPHKIIRCICDDREERALRLGGDLSVTDKIDHEVNLIIADATVNTSHPYEINRFL